MSAAYFNPPLVRRYQPVRPTVELNPHSINVIGTQPILSIILDMGEGESAVIVKLPTDLQVYLQRKLSEKLP